MKRTTRVAMALLALLGILLTSTNLADAAGNINNTDDAVSSMYVAGSDTTYFLLNELGAAYMESEGCTLTSVALPLVPASQYQNVCVGSPKATGGLGAAEAATGQTNANIYENYDHDVLINYYPQGSSAGRRQLCAQLDDGVPPADRDPRVPRVDIARSSAAPTEGFQCTVNNGAPVAAGQRVLRFVAFARDALTWAHWGGGASAAVTNLTQAEINGIYVTCSITNWNQVGGGNAPIVVFTAIPASGSRDSWDTFVGGESDSCIPPECKEADDVNDNDAVDTPSAGDPNGCDRVVREHFANNVEEATGADAAGNTSTNEANAMYWMSIGLHNVSPGQAGASLLGDYDSGAGILDSGDNALIEAGQWPYTRLLYNVIIQSGTSPVASEAVRRFTNSSAGSQDQGQGWICKPESAHSQPQAAGAGVNQGIQSPFASVDYGRQPVDAIRANGFFPVADLTGRRCNFFDYRVDQAVATFVGQG